MTGVELNLVPSLLNCTSGTKDYGCDCGEGLCAYVSGFLVVCQRTKLI